MHRAQELRQLRHPRVVTPAPSSIAAAASTTVTSCRGVPQVRGLGGRFSLHTFGYRLHHGLFAFRSPGTRRGRRRGWRRVPKLTPRRDRPRALKPGRASKTHRGHSSNCIDGSEVDEDFGYSSSTTEEANLSHRNVVHRAPAIVHHLLQIAHPGLHRLHISLHMGFLRSRRQTRHQWCKKQGASTYHEDSHIHATKVESRRKHIRNNKIEAHSPPPRTRSGNRTKMIRRGGEKGAYLRVGSPICAWVQKSCRAVKTPRREHTRHRDVPLGAVAEVSISSPSDKSIPTVVVRRPVPANEALRAPPPRSSPYSISRCSPCWPLRSSRGPRRSPKGRAKTPGTTNITRHDKAEQ